MSSFTQVIFATYLTIFYQTSAERVFEHCGLNEQKNKVLSGATLKYIVGINLFSCIKECQARTTCMSINFNAAPWYCELNAASDCVALTDKPGWTFIEKSNWIKSMDFACQQGMCAAGYKCVELQSTCTICMRSECGEPPKLNHAVFGTTIRDFNTTSSYQCLGDYEMYGNVTLTCQSNGNWTELESQNTGCGIPGIEPCTTNVDCQSAVKDSECLNGLCVCANFTTYSSSQNICFTDCKSLYEQSGRMLQSGVYQVQLNGANTTSVYCDMDRGGWTTIQRNAYDKSEPFKRRFDGYVEGFGSPNNSHWLGLSNIQLLTSSASQLLLFIRRRFDNEQIYMLFDRFKVGEPNDYKLTIGNVCNTTTGYELVAEVLIGHHNDNGFSTYDSDKTSQSCSNWTGAFWLNSCCSICGINRDHDGYYTRNAKPEYFSSVEMKVIRKD